jgi:hypothetical protein
LSFPSIIGRKIKAIRHLNIGLPLENMALPPSIAGVFVYYPNNIDSISKYRLLKTSQ